jgi:Tfp pilus assembly protein PilO
MARRWRFDIRQSGRQIAAVLGAVTLINLVAYALVVRPRIQEYQRLQVTNRPRFDALEQRREEVTGRETYLAALRQAEVDLRELREKRLGTREERLVEVQLELAEMAKRFGIDLETVTYKNDVLVSEELDRLEMVVPLEGGYANLRRFLQAVESSNEFLVVERVGLAEGKQGGVMLQLNITLVTYFTLPPGMLAATTKR